MGMPGIEGPWVAPIFTAGVQCPNCHPRRASSMCLLLCNFGNEIYSA